MERTQHKRQENGHLRGGNDNASTIRKEQEQQQNRLPHHQYRLVEDCNALDYPRLIHPPSTWKHIQDMFILSRKMLRHEQEVPEEERFKRKLPRNEDNSGMLVPYIVKDDGPKGRSLYASEKIPKGTKVWKSKYFVRFWDKEQYTTFLQLLPPELQCDVLLWTYGSEEQAFMALDVGSYVNHGVGSEVNIDEATITLRDIQPGEELLQDYSGYVGVDQTLWFDEIRDKAWGSPSEKEKEKLLDSYVFQGAPTTSKKDSNHNNVSARTINGDENSKLQFTTATFLPYAGFIILMTFLVGKKQSLGGIVKVEGFDSNISRRGRGRSSSSTTTTKLSSSFIRRRGGTEEK